MIRSFKSKYRSLFLIDPHDWSNKGTCNRISLKEGLYMIGEAWKQVNCITIVNSWSKVDISYRILIQDIDQFEDHGNLMELSLLISSVMSSDVLDSGYYLI